MEDQPRSSTSITRQEPSDARDITTMPLTSETPGYTLIHQTVNGTNSSNTKRVNTSSIKKVKYLMLMLRMKKELMLLLPPRAAIRSINNLELSMLIKEVKSKLQDSIQSLDSRLINLSILSPECG